MLPSQPEAKAAKPTDPLGRQTPNGCFLGFLNAARLGNYQTAAQYLQLSPALGKSKGEQLSMKLKTALDLGLVGPLKDVSANTDGTVEEGLPLERERVGRVSVNNHELNVDLVQVSDADAGQIWLFSADTLARIPEFYDKLQAQPAHTKLPAFLVKMNILKRLSGNGWRF